MPLSFGHVYNAGVLVGKVKLVIEGKLTEVAGKLSDTLPKLTDVGSPVGISSDVTLRLRLGDSGREVRDSVGKLGDRVGKVTDGGCSVGIEIVDSVRKLTDTLGTLMDDKLFHQSALWFMVISLWEGTYHCARCRYSQVK